MMNQIERLRSELAGRFPALVMEIDAPVDDRGPWFLDVRREEAPPVIVEWRADRGFGISTLSGDDYGSGPDEVYPNVRAAADRVRQLILSGGRTEPPQSVSLADLRRALGFSQAELAKRAGVGQSNLSKIETRNDVLLSTLARIVAAMGASLSIRARFPDGAEKELKVADLLSTAPPVPFDHQADQASPEALYSGDVFR